MKLYTKRGDDGWTELFGGGRVLKSDPRVAAYGEVDEANATIGVALAACHDDAISAILRHVQADLFVVGGELAAPVPDRATVLVDEADVRRLEEWIDEASDEVPPLRTFVLPGGSPLAAAMHLARCACRRAERAAVSLATQQSVRPVAIVYLNRLSDLLFALARLANQRSGVADIPWTPRKQ